MKKLLILAALIISGFAFKADAQVRVNVGVNIGLQPEWGPTGYDYVNYYYLPDIDAYYYVPRREFVYLSGGRWIFAASLPARYSDYDLYNSYKVVVNEPRPYLRDNIYRTRYASYRGRRGQEVLRDSRSRWNGHNNGNHYGWRNNKWKKDDRNWDKGDRGNGRGRGKGKHD